jgi:hypothetical protein
VRATSLQIHLGVTQENAKRYYNASLIASSFLVAISANSPFLFGKELWDESRIAVFEQAVELDSFRDKEGKHVKRVTLGSDYIHHSMLELFLENLDGYPTLLPSLHNEDASWLSHLRLHNGTIWRWTRPIVGLSKDGSPHLRIEQRAPSSGPTIQDSVANSMFFIGLTEYFANLETPLENQISYKQMSSNFYRAAKLSLDAEIEWIDGPVNIQKYILDELYQNIVDALTKLKVDNSDIERYMHRTIMPRLKHSLNGAKWQKAFIHTHGPRFQEMIEEYQKNQKSGKPVGEWSV